MSKRSDLLVACMLGNRWRLTTGSTVAAIVSAVSPTAPDAQSRPHLETLWYSIRNFVGAGAANTTVQMQIRNASVAGTVLASVDHLVGFSTTTNVAIANMQLAGKRGSKFYITTDTAVASVAATINACGWFEDTNG